MKNLAAIRGQTSTCRNPESHAMPRISAMRRRASTLCLLLLGVLASDAAWASCAEDLTRIQLALPKAAPDVQSRVGALISDAQTKARAKDGAGCEASTALALQSLGLPALAPIILSTPTTQPPGSGAPGQAQAKPAPAVASRAASVPQTNPPAKQSKPAPAAPQGPGTASGATAADRFFVVTSDVIGLDVINSDAPGETLGRLSSIIIESGAGQAQYAVIDRGGFLSFDRHHVIVPFGLLRFSGQWDRPSLSVSAFKLENGPQVSDQDLERLLNDPAWVRSLADYFGVAGAAGQPAPVSASSSPNAAAQPSTQPGQVAAQPTANATTGTQSAGDGAAHGQAVAQRFCAVCHTLNSGGHALVGPNLYGVVGRSVASAAGYNYSDALKGLHGDWDPSRLDAFLKNPRGYAPGTHMTFSGITSQHDRQDVIAYLQTLGGQQGAKK